MSVDGHFIKTEGTFASEFRTIVLQTPATIQEEINSRNFTKVELNGQARSSVYIDGVIVFSLGGSTKACPMELRRQKGQC